MQQARFELIVINMDCCVHAEIRFRYLQKKVPVQVIYFGMLRNIFSLTFISFFKITVSPYVGVPSRHILFATNSGVGDSPLLKSHTKHEPIIIK